MAVDDFRNVLFLSFQTCYIKRRRSGYNRRRTMKAEKGALIARLCVADKATAPVVVK